MFKKAAIQGLEIDIFGIEFTYTYVLFHTKHKIIHYVQL